MTNISSVPTPSEFRPLTHRRQVIVANIVLLLLTACSASSETSGDGDVFADSDSQAAVYTDITVDLNRPLSDSQRTSINRYKELFPSSIAIPPIIDDTGNLPGWHNISSDGFKRLVYPSQNPPLKTDPHFFQFQEQPEDHDFSLQNLLTFVQQQTGLPFIDRNEFVDIEAWTEIFGVGLRASYKTVNYEGIEIHWFIDALGIREDGTMLVNLIYAESKVFDSWDGILLPLVFNGHVQDPAIFTSRDVFTAGTFAQKTQFYAAVVNTNAQNQFGILQTLSAGAQLAMDNAVTISECGAASNCTVSYVGSRAVADYN